MAAHADDINAVDEYGDTALHRAAEHGSVLRIHQLLRDGANIEVRNENGATPLIVAVANEQYDAIERLLEGEADIHARDDKGDTALHYAAGASNPELTSRLLEARAHPESRNSNGATPIHAVVEHPTHIEPGEASIKTINVLMRAGSDLNYQDKNGNTALHYLADGRIGSARQLTEALLERGARTDLKNHQGLTSLETTSPEDSAVKRINSRLVRDAIQQYQERQQSPEVDNNPIPAFEEHDAIPKTGLNLPDLEQADRLSEASPLHVVAAAGDLQKVDHLLNQGADPNELDANHRTPLHEAVDARSLETVDRLLDGGANPNMQDAYLGHTALHRAVHVHSSLIAERLLQSAADPNLRDASGDTPLHAALKDDSEEKQLPTVNLLITYRARLYLSDRETGSTPLSLAAASGKTKTAERLLKEKVHPNTIDKNGYSTLHLAARRWQSSALTQQLLLAGASPHIRTPEGHTPLHQAVLYGSADSVERLLQSGADPNSRTKSDQTPLHFTIYSKSPDKVDRLLKAGADPNARDAGGTTPLHSAVLANSTKAIDSLLKYGADLKAHVPGKLGTPQELARECGLFETADHLARAENARNTAEQRSPSRVQRFINRFETVDQDIPDKTANGSRGKSNASIEQHSRTHHKEKPMPETHWSNSKSARQFTEQVAERVSKQVEQGKAPWQKGWDKPTGADLQPFNPATLKRFKGLNAVQLQSVSEEKGYSDPRWMSFRTANRIGAKIRKGERGTRVEYLRFPPKSQDKPDKDTPAAGANGKEKEQPKITHGTYVVFNAEQIEKMPPLEQQLAKEPQQHEICERAERMIEDAGVKIEQPDKGQFHSYYDKEKDTIVQPDMENFKSPEGYYGQAVKGMTDRGVHEHMHNRSEPRSEAQQHSSIARRDMRSEMACQTISAKLHLPKQPTCERHKAQWAETIRNNPNELRYAARDADRIADKVLEHDRPQQRQPSEPPREAVAAAATPERMMETQRQLQQQPQQEMAAMSR